jgi:hypothetical protein
LALSRWPHWPASVRGLRRCARAREAPRAAAAAPFARARPSPSLFSRRARWRRRGPAALAAGATTPARAPAPAPPAAPPQGLHAGYAHRQLALGGAAGAAGSPFVNSCQGALGVASSSVALVDTTDGASLVSPASLALAPGAAFSLTFSSPAAFALASLALPLSAPAGGAGGAVGVTLSFAAAADVATPLWTGAGSAALGGSAAFARFALGGAAGAAGAAYVLTIRVDAPAQWAYALPLATAAGALPALAVAADGGAVTAAALLPGLQLLADLTDSACVPALAPAGPQASAAAAALFGAAAVDAGGAAAAAAAPAACVTDNALVFDDSLQGGRFVSQAGVAVPAGATFALVMPWACSDCVVHVAEVILPLVEACGVSPVTMTANVGRFAGGAFVQSAAEAAAPLVAAVAVSPLATAFTFAPPAAWTLPAPAAADVGASALAITVRFSGCVTWGSGVAGAARPGTALFVAPAGSAVFAPTAELGGATVVAWTTPAASCAAGAPAPAPAPAPAASPAPAPRGGASPSAAASPAAANGNTNANLAAASAGSATSGLSGGAVAGVVIGCVVGAAALVAAGVAVTMRRRRGAAAAAAPAAA